MPTLTKQLTHTELAQQYLSSHRDDTMLSRGQWHRYVNGLWQQIHEQVIYREVWSDLRRFEQCGSCRPSRAIKSSVIDYLSSELFVDSSMLDSRTELINMKNGVFSLDDCTLYPHSPAYYLTSQLPFEFDKNAYSSRWQRYLETTFVESGSVTTDYELVSLVQEATGYSLTTDISHHVTFWCHGEGQNGKGVLFHVLSCLAGNAATSLNVGLLKREQYQLANLAGKRIALCSEADATDNLIHDALIKSIVSGDQMSVRQIRSEPFDMIPTVKLWWSMNELPTIADTSYGFWRRVRVIPFNRIFSETERDTSLKQSLSCELPGIFNWAMDGLKRLRSNGKFTQPSQVTLATDKYRLESNKCAVFIQECCIVDPSFQIGTSALYQSYSLWCSNSGYKPYGKITFGKEMRRLGYGKIHTNTGDRFTGLKPKPLVDMLNI